MWSDVVSQVLIFSIPAPQKRCVQLRPAVHEWRNWADSHWQTLHDEFGSKWVCRIFFPQSWVCPTRLKGILNLIQSYSQCFNGNIRVCLKHFVYKQIIRKFQGEKSLKFLMKIYFAKNLLIYPSYYQRIALNLINVI